MAAAKAKRPRSPLSIIREESGRAKLSLDASVPGLLGAYLRHSGGSAVSAAGQPEAAGDLNGSAADEGEEAEDSDNSAADDDEPEQNQPEDSAAGAAAHSAEGAAGETVAGAAEKHPKCPAGKTETPNQTRARVAKNQRKNRQGLRKVYGKAEWVPKEEPPPPGPKPHKTTKYVDRERIPAITCCPKTINNDLNRPIEKDEVPAAAGADKVFHERRSKSLNAAVGVLISKVTEDDSNKTLARQMQTRKEVNLVLELKNLGVQSTVDIIRYAEHGQRVIVLVERGTRTLGGYFNLLHKEKVSASQFIHKAAGLFRDCTRGLVELHERECAHRDVKAANIIQTENRGLKYIDFGYAKIDTDGTGFSGFAGTVGHQAPDLLLDRYDCQVDVFSLGRTFLHCLTGKSPYLEEFREIFQFVVAMELCEKMTPAEKQVYRQRRTLPADPRLKKEKLEARRTAVLKTFDLSLAEVPCKAMDELLKNEDFKKGSAHLIRWATSLFPAERPTARQLLDHPMFHEPGYLQVTSFQLDDGSESASLEISQFADKDDLVNGKAPQQTIDISIPDIGSCSREQMLQSLGETVKSLSLYMVHELRDIIARVQNTCHAVALLRVRFGRRSEKLIAARAKAINDWKTFQKRGQDALDDALKGDPDKPAQAAQPRPVERKKGGSEGCAEGEQVGRALPQLEGLLVSQSNVEVRRPRLLEGDPPELHRLFYSDDEDEENIDFSGFVSVLKPAEDAYAPPADGKKRERVFALNRCYGHYCVLKNLPTVNWTADQLKSELVPQFRKFGRCIHIDVAISKNPERFGERYIYCDYKQDFEARRAVQALDKFELDGHFLDAIYEHKQKRLGGPCDIKEAEPYVNRLLLMPNSQVPFVARIDGLPYDYTKKELYDMAAQAGGNIVDHSIFGQKERPENGSFGIIAFADDRSSLAFIDGIKDGSIKDEYYPHSTLSAEAITSKAMPLPEPITKIHSTETKIYQSADGEEEDGNEEATITDLPGPDLALSPEEATALQRILAPSGEGSPERHIPQEERDAMKGFAKMALSWPKE